MQIQTTQRRHQPNFTALHIANAGALKLIKITDIADKKYLKELPDKINIKELMPNLTNDEANRWNEMLEYAVARAQKNNNTYIETINDKICGIITYSLGKNSKLDCICTWPVEIGKKVKLAGKTLFYQMFKDFQAQGGKKLELEAITNGPVDTVKKYEELGFQKNSNVFATKRGMETNIYKVKDTLKKLNEIIDYETIEPEKINLNNLEA